MAIRMAPTAVDLNGHAYDLYEQPISYPNTMSIKQKIEAMQNPPDNWYDRLYNSMLFLIDYAKEKDRTAPWFLLLIKNTVRCDEHWFPFNDANRQRGDGKSMPRVNLSLAGSNPEVVSNSLMEDLVVNTLPETVKVEAYCDLVITRIQKAPSRLQSGESAHEFSPAARRISGNPVSRRKSGGRKSGVGSSFLPEKMNRHRAGKSGVS